MSEKYKIYQDLFINSPISYLVLDEAYNIIMSNLKAEKLFNTKLDGLDFMEFVCDAYINDFKSKIVLVKKQTFVKFDTAICIEGKKRFVTVKINCEDNLLRVILKDNTIEHQAFEEMEYVSFHDHLTSVYNRRYLFDSLKRLDQPSSYPIGVIFADINGLKIINDAFGHDAGDDLIKIVAKLMSESIRNNDLLARISGDEFVVVLPNTTNDVIEGVIARFKEIASKVRVRDTMVSVAFGYAIKTQKEQDINKVLTLAENKMYEDKMVKRSYYRKCTVEGLLEKLFSTHENEREHADNVMKFSLMIGRRLNYSEDRLEQLRLASLLHDIGKIAVDYSLIEKTGSLTVDEFSAIKEHSAIGYRILSSASIFGDIPEIILSHHERVDGKGYPRQLVGIDIKEEARIIAICDAFDAMTSSRSYQDIRTKEDAVAELIRFKGIQFDNRLTEIFIDEIMKTPLN